MREIIFLGVLFLLTFVLFVFASFALTNINTLLDVEAVSLGIETSTRPVIESILTSFQVIFGILTVGLGIGIILAIMNRRNYNENRYG